MNIIPMGERVLIQPKEEERTRGGIYLPVSVKESKKEGEVVALGQFKDGKDLPLKKGDRILYGGYSYDEFEAEGKRYIVIEFKDVLAKLE